MKKQANRASPIENAPLWVLRTTSPGGGSLFSASLSANLCCSFYSAARISPSGGDAAAGGRRGAFSSRHRRGCEVFPSPVRAVVRSYPYWRRSRLPQPSAAQPLSNLSFFRTFGPKGRQPSRPSGRVPNELTTVEPRMRMAPARPAPPRGSPSQKAERMMATMGSM